MFRLNVLSSQEDTSHKQDSLVTRAERFYFPSWKVERTERESAADEPSMRFHFVYFESDEEVGLRRRRSNQERRLSCRVNRSESMMDASHLLFNLSCWERADAGEERRGNTEDRRRDRDLMSERRRQRGKKRKRERCRTSGREKVSMWGCNRFLHSGGAGRASSCFAGGKLLMWSSNSRKDSLCISSSWTQL